MTFTTSDAYVSDWAGLLHRDCGRLLVVPILPHTQGLTTEKKGQPNMVLILIIMIPILIAAARLSMVVRKG